MSIARTRCGARLAVDYSGAGGSLPGERLRWFVRIGPMPQPHAAPQSPSSSRTPWRLQRQAPAAPPLASRGATPPEQRDHRAAASTLARSSAPRPRAPRTSLPLLEHQDPQRVSRLIKPAALRPAAPCPPTAGDQPGALRLRHAQSAPRRTDRALRGRCRSALDGSKFGPSDDLCGNLGEGAVVGSGFLKKELQGCFTSTPHRDNEHTFGLPH
jgi:hypothetical protein